MPGLSRHCCFCLYDPISAPAPSAQHTGQDQQAEHLHYGHDGGGNIGKGGGTQNLAGGLGFFTGDYATRFQCSYGTAAGIVFHRKVIS